MANRQRETHQQIQQESADSHLSEYRDDRFIAALLVGGVGGQTFMEMNVPKIPKGKIVVHQIFRGEPHAWQRATQGKFGRFRLVDSPENVKAKKELVEKFEWKYPRFAPIARQRNLGTQMFFQTCSTSKDKDNMEKLVNDAFNGVIWIDDRQIKEGYQRVRVVPESMPAFTQLVVYLLDYGS